MRALLEGVSARMQLRSPHDRPERRKEEQNSQGDVTDYEIMPKCHIVDVAPHLLTRFSSAIDRSESKRESPGSASRPELFAGAFD